MNPEPPPRRQQGPRPMPPPNGPEETQIIRRPQPNRQAWSQAPIPPSRYDHAPTQQPQPYDEREYVPRPQSYAERPPRYAPAPPRPPVPQQPPPVRQPPARPPRVRRRKSPWRWVRRVFCVLIVLLLLIGWAGYHLDGKMKRFDALAAYPGRVGDTPGTNWLLVGSDSRAGLTPEEQAQLTTGDDAGNERTDTIMLVHIPESGTPTLVSIPRDSYVPIPGYGTDKINAAYAFGVGEEPDNPARGAQLLVQTVEEVTGLHIDHFGEIGFAGFAEVVDAIGGVDLCLDQPIDDPKAGINLPAGCQKLDGTNALGFVRTRSLPGDDFTRIQNQRKFLSALLSQSTKVGMLANPFKTWPLANDAVATMRVDEDSHIWDLAQLGWALHGDIVTTTVPIAGTDVVDVGDVVLWDRERALEFFDALAHDRQIPESLVTTGP